MNKENFILETFLRLTSRTYPYKTEGDLVNAMTKLQVFPKGIREDDHGNFFYKIGKSRTMFTSHLDTSGHDQKSVNHIFDGDLIKTDGKTILGADDKAGTTIMLFMIMNNIPGLYYFFVGEEVGCIGSGKASRLGDFKGKYDRVVSFDRRDVDSVITYQSFTRCCSDEFANDLAKQLNKSGLKYKIDEGGVYTDSAEFTNIIPECTNISVGYYKEHTSSECQDIKHLEKLANACLTINWESLPIKRDPLDTEYRTYTIKSNKKIDNNITYYGDNRYNKKSNSYKQNRGGSSSGYGNGYNWMDDPENDDWNWDQKDRITERKDKSYTGLVFKNLNEDKKKSKKFYDNGNGELVQISEANYYEGVSDKILNSKLTKEDLKIIKYQYFDMSNGNDMSFYEYIKELHDLTD